jgi:hypothetical protein
MMVLLKLMMLLSMINDDVHCYQWLKMVFTSVNGQQWCLLLPMVKDGTDQL